MSFRRWDPFAEMMSMRQMVDRLFAESFTRPPRTLVQRPIPRSLPVDVYETADSYVVKAALSGAKPDDVKVSVVGSVLSIKGEVKADEAAERESHLYREHPLGAFARDVRLPAAVQADKVEARFADGVLVVTVPKGEEAEPQRIEIQT